MYQSLKITYFSISLMFKKMFKDPETFASRSVKGPDQMMLQKYVWKTWGKWSSVQHGNYIVHI